MANHEIKEFQEFSGYCCDGFTWVVACMFDDSIVGCCQNLDCPDYDAEWEKRWETDDPYRGVSIVSRDDFEGWLDSLEAVQSG